MKLLAYTFEELTDELAQRYGKGAYHAAAICRELFKRGNRDFSNAPEFAKSGRLLARMEGDLSFDLPEVVRQKREGAVVKFVSRLSDGCEIESVVVPMTTYKTLCVSSQVGCRMGCRFCETGRMGFTRNLTASEITGQLFAARFILGHDIKNIVFMGMGEPLDNFNAVTDAIRVFSDQRGFDVAKKNITVSTVGLADGIDRLAKLDWPQLKLAVSLNAPDDGTRSALMPVNRKTAMAELRKALARYPLKPKGDFLVEYVLIEGMNDGKAAARKVADYLSPLSVRLNLIPYNPGKDAAWEAPSDKAVHRFGQWLEAEGVFVRKRWSKGRSLMAGCGQLGSGKSLPESTTQP